MAHGSGRLPSVERPVNPLPTPISTRPGASSTSVAIDAAVVIGWRRLGIRTPVPSPIVLVRSAHRVSVMKTSGYSAGESYSQARRYPSCSARTTWSGVSIEVAKAQEMSMHPSLFPHLGAIRIGARCVSMSRRTCRKSSGTDRAQM